MAYYVYIYTHLEHGDAGSLGDKHVGMVKTYDYHMAREINIH